MENYRFIRSLGKGHFGHINLYQNNTTRAFEAIKHIPRCNVNSHIEAELINHIKLDHENVVRFEKVFMDDKSDEICIVMEYANGGDLFEVVSKQNGVVEEVARAFFQQIIIAVNYCHTNTICHRDIKLENILLTTIGQIKLCDFGLSFDFNSVNPESCVGTPAYIAPEIMNKRPYDGEKVDVWSCGVVLYVMLYGYYPFDDKKTKGNARNMIRNITNKHYHVIFRDNKHISQECQDLIRKMLHRDPTERISITEIMDSVWFQQDFITNMNIVHDLSGSSQSSKSNQSRQSIHDIIKKVVPDQTPSEIIVQPTNTTEEEMDFADWCVSLVM